MIARSAPARACRNWRALLATALVALGCAADVPAASIEVDPADSTGAVPALFRPSAMLAYADGEAIAAFLDLPGRVGTVRLTLEPLITESKNLQDYLDRLERATSALTPLSSRGADIVFLFARTPRWLARTKDESLVSTFGFTRREAAPPNDPAAFAELVYKTVGVINGKHGLAPWYEFWNEPDNDGFWTGTQDELFSLYDAFARAARRADPKARVGGFAVSAWDARRKGAGAPMLEALLKRAGQPGAAPIDFISWHNFGKFPEDGWISAENNSRKWLAQSGLPAAFPQIVTEWNRWTTFPDWYDKSREGALGAANYIATLHAMDRAGIRSQTVAALQDFNAPPRDQAFIGDFGLVTRQPMVKKASFHALNLLALLEPGRIRATVPEQEGEAQGVDVLATGNAGKMAILVSRFANDPQGSVVRSLRNHPADAPDTPAGKGGISGEQLGAYLQRKTELAEFNLPPKSQDALAKARKQYDLARTPAGDLPLRINIRGKSGPYRYKLYLIDRDHANPEGAYRAALAKGDTFARAIAAAREQTLAVVASGTGALPELRLQPHAVALLLVEADAAK